jgi:hypothetical protein
MAGLAVDLNIGFDVIQVHDVLRRQHISRWTGREDAAVAHQDQLAANGRREVQVMRRDGHRDALLLVEPKQQR